MPRDVIKYGPDAGPACDEGHDDAIASVRDLLCGDGCGEAWCLAHNLAVAGGLEFARLCGFHMGMSNDHPMNWHPMDRRPAPGWEGEP